MIPSQKTCLSMPPRLRRGDLEQMARIGSHINGCEPFNRVREFVGSDAFYAVRGGVCVRLFYCREQTHGGAA